MNESERAGRIKYVQGLTDGQVGMSLKLMSAAVLSQRETLEKVMEELSSAVESESLLREETARRRLARSELAPDWVYLLDTTEPGIRIKHDALNKALKSLLEDPQWAGTAIGLSGNFVEIGQVCLQIALIKNRPDLTARVLEQLENVLLPFVQLMPAIDSRGKVRIPYKHLSIFESTLSQNAVFYLAINEGLGMYEVRSSSGSREQVHAKEPSLAMLLKVVENNFFYENAEQPAVLN